jgi:alpha-L-fucosidase
MNAGSIHARWNWGNGITPPDEAYCQAFYDRTIDLINQADPDLVYFDDTALPLWPVSDAGLKIAAHHYNRRATGDGAKTDAVLFGKILDEQQRRCIVWDIERGQSSRIEPEPWQTDTCLGGWHYDRGVYDRKGYKSAATVVRTLIDVVSKNGSLLLNVPVRSDGTIDDEERAIVEGIADWMAGHNEAIIATRPWKVCGEGPQLEDAPPLTAQGFNEGKGKPFTAEDIRYTQRDGVVYAFVMARPEGKVTFRSLAKKAGHLEREIAQVEQLGHGDVAWVALESGVEITPAVEGVAADLPVVFRITAAE